MLILNDMIYRFPHKIISLHKNGNINLTNCNLESKHAMALVVNTKYVGNIITLGTGKVLKEQVGGY